MEKLAFMMLITLVFFNHSALAASHLETTLQCWNKQKNMD
jgi:hypothetical protein